MNPIRLIVLTAVLVFCSRISLADAGQPAIRLPVTRDTWVSNVGKEGDTSNGGSAHLKLKSIQEMSLIDIDPSVLKGHVIASATLHIHLSGAQVLHRVTVSSVGAEWIEGDARDYDTKPGVSTFNHRVHPDVPWAYPGSDLTAVVLGAGGTIWRMAEASAPDAGHWQTIAVDPAVVAARVAGISQGFLLFDDTGTEWTRDGEQFTLHTFPNRLFDSKDSNRASAPYIEVILGETDSQPPGVVLNIKSQTAGLPPGEARLSWQTPKDAGASGVAGFLVDVDGKPAPRYLIPAADPEGQTVQMHLRDLVNKPGQTVAVKICAVDGAGNIGPAESIKVTLAGDTPALFHDPAPAMFKSVAALPKLGGAQIAIIDTLDKMQPVTGQMIPPQEAGYMSANHLWDGKTIHLFGAKNEIVSFQILVRGHIEHMTAKLQFDPHAGEDAPAAEFFSPHYVASKIGPVPDPLMAGKAELTIPQTDEPIAGQTNGSLLCELPIAFGQPAGNRMGTLTLAAGAEELKIPVELTVWDFALPDSLSFIPEMNCYGLPENEIDYYRLAHRNRTALNRVAYHHDGSVTPGCAPIWNPQTRTLDWSKWDKRFGQYFDGSAFDQDADVHIRRHVPLEVFYLPLFENWPTPMAGNYNGDYWADRAFTGQYQQDFVEVSRQFARHFNEKGWNQTLFQCYFNGKNNFKQRGWSHGTSPWLLDEPANFQDFWALKFFGELFWRGINSAPDQARLLFRADISRPQWQRDSLDHLLDYNVVNSGAFHQYRRIVIDRKERENQILVVYGTTNDPADSNMQPAGWCIDAWTLGADGVLPWQTIGEQSSWKKADALSLFYPSPAGEPPVPSIRLKSYLRGEQDVEYLTLLGIAKNQFRAQIGPAIRAQLPLTGQTHGTGFTADEDAGVTDFAGLRPQDLWKLRMQIARVLNEAHPRPERKLVNWQTPRRDPDAGPRGYVQ